MRSPQVLLDPPPAPPDAADDDLLLARLYDLHQLEQTIAAEKLRLINELHERKTHHGMARDTADLLTVRLNLTRPEAATLVRTATALPQLPATAHALAAGDITTAQATVAANTLAELDRLADAGLPVAADATTRLDHHVATRAPICDRTVLRRELDTLTHTLCQGSLADKERAAHHRRDARLVDHDDATTSLHVRVGAAHAAKMRAYLDAQARLTGPHDTRTRGQRLADAVIDLFDHGLAQDLPEVAARRPHALIITTRHALHDTPGAEPTWLDGHGPVSSATANHICCDAETTIVTRTADGTVIDAKPWRKNPTKAQRAAVIARDKHCVGCGAPASRCEIHHIQWRRHHGKTILTNLALVCWNCHHRIHHDHWTVHTDETGAHTLQPPHPHRHTP